jgi:hypothetical protein
MTSRELQRYIRWQNYRITQYSLAINLFLTFAVAALGFTLTLLKEASFAPPPGTGWLLRYAIHSFSASITFGALATLSRLLDFRCTAIVIQKKYADWRQITANFLANSLCGASWSLFYLQLSALAYGSFQLTSLLLRTYDIKLRM